MNTINLYAGVGGNRPALLGDVTAVELNLDIASIYADRFPEDTVIVGDAHSFLEQNYKDYDFVWSSPPCQTHSQIRYNLGFKNRPTKAVYPDFRLYEEIVFLQSYFTGGWVVENTRSFYKPLIEPQLVGGHFFWANFYIPPFKLKDRDHRAGTVETLQEKKGVDLSSYNITNKRQILRNCVEPELVEHVINSWKKDS